MLLKALRNTQSLNSRIGSVFECHASLTLGVSPLRDNPGRKGYDVCCKQHMPLHIGAAIRGKSVGGGKGSRKERDKAFYHTIQ
ncbi:hypothetical protein Tco_1348673 [Tanacetum coccineum]